MNKELKESTFFHSTYADFEQFDFRGNSILGAHFGTKESALSRLELKHAETERIGATLPHGGQNPFLLEVKLNISNAIRLDENRAGKWSPWDVINEVMVKAESEGLDFISDEELDDFYEDVVNIEVDGELINFFELPLSGEPYKGEINPEEKEKLFVKDWLEAKGFDAIVYSNEFEKGGDSVLMLDESKIEVVNRVALNPSFQQDLQAKIQSRKSLSYS